MNWEKLAEMAWKYWIAGVFALVLLWFVLTNVAGAIKDHDTGTRSLLRAICAHTAETAGRDTEACYR